MNNHSTLNLNNEIKPYDKIPILNLKKIIGSKIDGIIGNDFFRDKIVFIDYHKEEVKISNDIKNVNLKNFYVFPFTQDITKGVVINLNLKIDNKDFKGNYLVDTGSPQFLTFTKTTALERRLDTIKSKKKFTPKIMVLVELLWATFFLQNH
ncbi:MAG: hypothetical protein M0D53_05945 [Flavobacterium sp. JAD_PAG50586_2]|nr:MAG: hypothetical protein M0D53_05945 [Flavobacterium sp. JAD_PAG50586_2]